MTQVRLRFLVPASSGDHVLLDPTGDLPTVEVDVESTVMSCSASAARQLGLGPPALDCFVDQTPDDDLGSATREALIVMPPPIAGHRPTDGLRWTPLDGARPRLPPALQAVCGDRLAQLGGRSEPHPLRVPWGESGWYERAVAWIERSLAAAGRAAPDDVVQYRHWGISAIMRVDAPDRRSWFKASFRPFAHEPVMTETIASIAPGLLPEIIATDHDMGWMLLDDIGSTEVDPSADAPAAIERLVSLQAELIGRVDDFRRAGCPDRSLERLPTALAAALDGATVAAAGIRPDVARRTAIVDAVARAVEDVLGTGMPTTIAHGDFHPGNVAVVAGHDIVVFDWSDACVTTPVMDLAVWSWWLDGDTDAQRHLHDLFRSAWSRHFGVDTSNLGEWSVDVVSAAFHAISYVGIVDHLEPYRWPENIDGVRRFFVLLDGLVD